MKKGLLITLVALFWLTGEMYAEDKTRLGSHISADRNGCRGTAKAKAQNNVRKQCGGRVVHGTMGCDVEYQDLDNGRVKCVAQCTGTCSD